MLKFLFEMRQPQLSFSFIFISVSGKIFSIIWHNARPQHKLPETDVATVGSITTVVCFFKLPAMQ
jgi:hypothetical protein